MTLKMFTLIGTDGKPCQSETRGTLGGHRQTKIFGDLTCRTALRHIAKGQYVQHRVFFADRATAEAAGYRPCGTCLPDLYKAWKAGRPAARQDGAGL